MLSRFDFLLRAARPFVYLVELDFLRQRESIYFVTIESIFIIAIRPYSVSTSKNISDQHSSKF